MITQFKKLFSLSALMILVALGINAQDLKKLIDNGKLESLEKYVSKKGDLKEKITVTIEEKEHQINGLIYLLGKETLDENHQTIFDYFISKINLFDNSTQVVDEAFIYSFSIEGGEYYTQKLWELKPNLKSVCSICNENTALIAAAVYGNEEWYFKLKPSSDINAVNKAGFHLLSAAIFGENTKIIKDVLETDGFAGKINTPNKDGFSPLDMAFGCRDKSIVDLILKAGANVEQSNNLLWEAASYYNTKIFDLPYIIKGSDKYFNELWKVDEGDYTILSYLFVWNTELIDGIEYSDLLIQEKDFSQAKMIKTCLNAIVQSVMSPTFDAAGKVKELQMNIEEVNNDLIFFISKYYTSVDEYLMDDSKEMKEAIQLLNDIVCELKNLDAALQKKNMSWITEKNKKNATKYLSGILTECSW